MDRLVAILEPRLVFPILLVSDGVSVFAEPEAFERHISLVTDKAIRDGFLRNARIVGADGTVLFIHRLVLGKAPLLGWLKPRTIGELAMRVVHESVEVDLVRSWVVDAIEGLRDILSNNCDVDAVLARVRAARDLAAIRGVVSEVASRE